MEGGEKETGESARGWGGGEGEAAGGGGGAGGRGWRGAGGRGGRGGGGGGGGGGEPSSNDTLTSPHTPVCLTGRYQTCVVYSHLPSPPSHAWVPQSLSSIRGRIPFYFHNGAPRQHSNTLSTLTGIPLT